MIRKKRDPKTGISVAFDVDRDLWIITAPRSAPESKWVRVSGELKREIWMKHLMAMIKKLAKKQASLE